ncbi:MAG TPA: PQQ-binding-like beta-propeller repeat protein, partial [Humisphaera sp.]|nr:PQQ-binding-like beta-propeller repeat protein [Humisphaera sp.]
MTRSYLTLIVLTAGLAQSQSPKASEWPMYNRDLAGTRYSPLTQINTKNVANLKQVWSFQLKSDPTKPGPQSEATPIMVNDVMYLPAGNRIVALKPETGELLWQYVIAEGVPQRRGVTYWPGDQNNPPRIFFTSGRKLVGLNATTGKIDPGFGNEGSVDTVVPYQSAPTMYKNMLFIGANVPEQPATGPPGDTRAYDARTGAKMWEFHSVPHAGETGNETWPADAWKDRTGANNWGFSMTVDEARGILYTTYGSPASDFYGGDRKGNDLFGNSVVALDAATGKMKWYFQAVHHDTWDFDLPPAPGLMDVMINGKKTPILAQTGKVGYMYILNRETGKPIFGIDEKPVPQSNVPGEFSSPTQPIPVKPPPFGRMSFKPEDLVTADDTNAEHAAACKDLVERSGGLHNEGPFTTWVYRAPGAPPVSSVIFPGAIGGTNWGGTASDPKLGYVF